MRYEYKMHLRALTQEIAQIAEEMSAEGWWLLWPPLASSGFGHDLVFEREVKRDPMAVEEE